MVEADQFQLRLDGRPAENGALLLFLGRAPTGAMLAAHDLDEASPRASSENLACKTTGALALERLLATTDLAAEDVDTRLAGAARRRSATGTSAAVAT